MKVQIQIFWSTFVCRPSIYSCLQNILWNYSAKSNETFLRDPLQEHNKRSQLMNNNNKMADLLFCFKKHP